MTAPQTDAITDPLAVIAALQQRLDAALAREAALTEELAARDAAPAERSNEFGERIDHQAATLDVLKVMSASPGDPQPVFDLIVRRAQELCHGYGASLFEFDGTLVRYRAAHIPNINSRRTQAYFSLFPREPTRDVLACRAIIDKQIIHIRDIDSEAGLNPVIKAGQESVLAIPLLREGDVIGSILINSLETGGFSDAQVALLQTFAEQAVIAISSAETYRTLQTRTADLQESLEYQTATSDVLKVISRSTFDLQPVLTMVAETAVRLCFADQAAIFRLKDDIVHLAVNYGFPTEYKAYWDELGPVPLGMPIVVTALSRTIYERHSVHIHDVAAVPGYPDEAISLGKQRTSLGVPLLREGEPIGVILLARQRVEPFSDRQIELVSTFADQAVIAMENARLLTEQQEALEQQTATAEVLQVINASPGNLTPVFDAMLKKAMRLCGATFGSLTAWDGKYANVVAMRGFPSALAEYMAARGSRLAVSPMIAQLSETKRPQQLPDVMAGEGYRNGHPDSLAVANLGGARTLLHVPLHKDEAMLGYISVYRKEVRVFSDKEIALLENFAAQAVIAMENARLLTEQREALEQQTATAEVLQVINASPGDLPPVFDAMLEKAVRLCESSFGVLATYDGEYFHNVATRGVPPALADFLREPIRPEPGNSGYRIFHGEDVVHIADIVDDEAYRWGVPARRALADLGGGRTQLIVALRKDDALLGMVNVYRQEVRPFTHKQIALLQNFAAQAVIAMENARLITEQREALEQQTATAEVLQVINASPGDLAPVFDAMLERALDLCGAAFGILLTYDGELFHHAAFRSIPPAYVGFMREHPPIYAPESAPGRLALGERTVHLLDITDTDAYRSGDVNRRAIADLSGARTLVAVSLRKDGALVGAIAVFRQEVRPFLGKQIALLENFAAQAVIAIENTRLLTEQREALDQQTATAEVLQVINASPGNLTPVFDVILEKAHQLCGSVIGNLVLFDGTQFRRVAYRGMSGNVSMMLTDKLRQTNERRRLLQGERFIHVPNLDAPEAPRSEVLEALRDREGVRSYLLVPMRKDGVLLGYISANWTEPRPDIGREVALLENFAAQAVIAMENARLITEQREALEQQTATADVLGVINASPGDLIPVFDAMLEKAMHLCEAAFGIFWTYEDGRFHAPALRGVPPAFAEFLRKPLGPFHPGSGLTRLLRGEDLIINEDMSAEETYRAGDALRRAIVDLGGARTAVNVSLRKEQTLLGAITVFRQEVRPFSDKHIALLQNFAAQAVIAMENARLLDEIRQRQEELRVTFENMGDGVAMFDETQHLVAWNRKFQDILDLPDDIIARRQTFSEYVRYLADRGEYDAGADPEEHVRWLIEQASQARTYERVRPDGRVIEIRHNPVAGGGFVLIYADITERKRNEAEIRAARDAAEEASRTIETAFRELKAAQANLIQAEKMASLGQLTAGIAHEIKNPLNFVNNFAALSVDLLCELKETAAPGFAALTDDQRAEIEDVSAMLTSNLEKITEHGKRADSIVKAMLEHSRGSSTERRMVDLNALIDEALNLSYHGARAQDQSFNITLERDFAEGIAPTEVNPQDMTRVFLNLFGNGFYAATRRARNDAGFVPTLRVTTRDAGEMVEIRVRDNGTGIPIEIRDKLFQPFFTTKPTGEGTGLGLSITYDIVTKQHGGTITVDSEVDAFTEFVVTLPRQMFTDGGGRA